MRVRQIRLVGWTGHLSLLPSVGCEMNTLM